MTARYLTTLAPRALALPRRATRVLAGRLRRGQVRGRCLSVSGEGSAQVLDLPPLPRGYRPPSAALVQEVQDAQTTDDGDEGPADRRGPDRFGRITAGRGGSRVDRRETGRSCGFDAGGSGSAAHGAEGASDDARRAHQGDDGGRP